MTRLLVNADDMGLCESVNYGILSAYENGIVTSCTVMAGMPGFTHAIKLLKANPGLGVGVHMTLSLGRPVLDTHQTITDEEGIFYRRITDEKIATFDLEEVYEEFCAQIERVMAAGIKVTHLDSHHHVHTLKGLQPVIERVIARYQLPIRGGFKGDLDYAKTVPLMESFYADGVEEAYFEKQLETFKQYDCVDVMCHPAFVEEYLLEATSYATARMKEYSVLTSPRVKAVLSEAGITCIRYDEI